MAAGGHTGSGRTMGESRSFRRSSRTRAVVEARPARRSGPMMLLACRRRAGGLSTPTRFKPGVAASLSSTHPCPPTPSPFHPTAPRSDRADSLRLTFERLSTQHPSLFVKPVARTMPAPTKPTPHRMVFTTNSLRNTTIAVEDDALYYEVVTRFWHPDVTKVFKLDKESRELALIAEIQRRAGEGAKVRFGGEKGEWVDADEFLKWDDAKRCVSLNACETVRIEVERCSMLVQRRDVRRWRGRGISLEEPPAPAPGEPTVAAVPRRSRSSLVIALLLLQLVRADGDQKAPIADFHKHRRHFFVLRMSRHAFLEVKPEATESMDRLISACLSSLSFQAATLIAICASCVSELPPR